MDPVGPWSAYASYNRLTGVPPTASSGELHHHLAPGGGASVPPPTTSAQILSSSFLSPPTGYEAVFSPLFHHATSKPSTHYVTQHRQVLAQAQAAKQDGGEYHQTQMYFEQNPGAWQQNGPFGILPHESVVPTTTGKNYENFNVHFAAQSINHLNSLAAKNAAIRVQSPHAQVITTTTKTQPITTFYQVNNTTLTTAEASTTNSKSYPSTNTQNMQQSCIVTASNLPTKEYRIPQVSTRPPFLPGTNVPRLEKPFTPPTNKQPTVPQIQTKAQAKSYPEINHIDRQNEEQNQQSSPISFSIMDASRLNYVNSVTNNANKRTFPTNYRHYQHSTNNEQDFQRAKDFNTANGPDCNVVTPRRPSPLQAHSQVSPIGHAPSPAYPLYNSPMNTTISSPQTSSNQVTPPSPLDASVPRPNPQNNVAYSSVITRTLNPEKSYTDRFDRQNQNCWDDRRKFNNNYNVGNSIEIPNRQIDVPNRLESPQRQMAPLGISERQQVYFDSSHQVTLQGLSSCRGDPMSIVKNLQQQQQQSCHIQQPEIKQETKLPTKRRKSSEKNVAINEVPRRIPPPAHTSGTNQPPQNGAYFDFDRWSLPPPTSKIFTTQNIQHQGLMVPHPHTHHAPPPIPYFPPFHLAPPHHPEYTPTVEITALTPYNSEQPPPIIQQSDYQEPVDEQPKVVVPNIEEELNFLSESTVVAVSRPLQQQALHQNKQVLPSPKPTENKPSGVGFMSSYLKFLQGERDSSPPPPSRGGRKHTWTRLKPEVKEDLNGSSQPPAAPPPPPPLPPQCKRLSQGDPQDDPRYFPLPKERKQNSFDSSDDGVSSDDDLFNRKVIPFKDFVKEKPTKKGRPCKPGGPTEKKRSKQTKQLKHKKQTDKSVAIPKASDLENIPRRETSKRAAKEKVNIKSLITKAEEEVEEPNEFVDSDSDPAWTPAAKEDADEELSFKNKTKRGKPGTKKKGVRNLITVAAEGAGIEERDGFFDGQNRKLKPGNKVQLIGNKAPTLEDNIAAAVEKQKSNSNNKIIVQAEQFYKPGEFVVIKSELNQSWPAIWRVDKKNLLQKYEPFQKNGHTLYKNMSTYASYTPDNKMQYITIPVRYRSNQNHLEVIVEFMRNQMVIIDPEYVHKAMKESERFQDNFEVYVQTLISQALDSNFLTEIFQEKDDYFLSNVKTIDDITNGKRQKLMHTLAWPPSLHIAVSTWPCFNVIREFSNSDLLNRNCMGCGLPGVAVRVLMYGQPYNVTTLEGCQPNPRSANEKDFILCRICSNRVELYNKIAHQKYLMYIECAKRVADKRTTNPQKDTTCILNELLADEKWLGQLFRDARKYWAEVDSISNCLSQNLINNQ